MSFYQWRFRISLAALEDLRPAPPPGGSTAARPAGPQIAEVILLPRRPSSGFLGRIRLPWRRCRGPVARHQRPPMRLRD
jgi:hypothetical protein